MALYKVDFDLVGLSHLDRFALLRNCVTCSELFCIFPLGRFVFTLLFCKGRQAFLTALRHCLTCAGGVSVVEQHHDDDNSNKMNHRLTWCSEQAKQHLD